MVRGHSMGGTCPEGGGAHHVEGVVVRLFAIMVGHHTSRVAIKSNIFIDGDITIGIVIDTGDHDFCLIINTEMREGGVLKGGAGPYVFAIHLHCDGFLNREGTTGQGVAARIWFGFYRDLTQRPGGDVATFVLMSVVSIVGGQGEVVINVAGSHGIFRGFAHHMKIGVIGLQSDSAFCPGLHG